MKHTLLTLAIAATLSASAGAALAATAPLQFELRPYSFSSPVQAGAARGQVLASHRVEAKDAPWLRLIFKDVTLAPGSLLRITSVADGAQQTLNATTLRQWRNTSAYFNGSAVTVELIGAHGTRGNRFGIAQVMAGTVPAQTESQCGATDDRVPSAAANRARLLGVGCTANLTVDGCFITAGHCLSSPSLVNVVEFNVPLSNGNTSLNHPAPKDQYVPTTNRQFQNGGIGKDWGVFTVSANSETGLTPLQAQGPGLNFASSTPVVGATVEITGYGVDTGTANQTQQVSTGPITLVNTTSTRLEYKADTEGGNSGSAVLTGGDVVAIHTSGGCTTGGSGANSGTLISNAAFQSAYPAVCGAVEPGPTCGEIKKVTATCSASGKITVTTVLTNTTHDGQSVGVSIDSVPFDVPIAGRKAPLAVPGFGPGAHTVALTDPAGCGAPKTVTCP